MEIVNGKTVKEFYIEKENVMKGLTQILGNMNELQEL